MSGPSAPLEGESSPARGLQHERTALAWERTAFATLGVGAVLARFGVVHDQFLGAVAGLLLVGFGAGLLVWAGIHYESQHALRREGHDVANPTAARLVGVVTVVGCGLALVFGTAATL